MGLRASDRASPCAPLYYNAAPRPKRRGCGAVGRGMAQGLPQDVTGFAGSRVAITGGLGFIGSALAARLVELGARVLLIDSLAPNYGGNLFNIAPIRDRIEVAILDIRETQRLKPLLEGCDHLFNLAGQTSHLDSMHDPVT